MNHKFLLGILIFLLFFLNPSRASASGEFSSSYDVFYKVRDDGITEVTQNISLMNLTSNYYPSQYNLIFETEKIENVSAADRLGPLKVKVKKTDGRTEIMVEFNEKVVGIGKILNWSLYFETPEFGRKTGRIWEINIPKISNQEEVTNYNVNLSVPPGLNQKLAFVWPKPKRPYYWTLPESREGIMVIFGDWQGFSFDLSYHLSNNNFFPQEMAIAIPPDTPYQKIILDKIDPQPKNIFIDEDGNWLAIFSLLPKQKLTVKVNGKAQVFLNPQPDYPKENKKAVFERYLKPKKFWESDDPEIVKLANELKTPEKIYEYVVSTLNYDYERAKKGISRLGAKLILSQPNKAICMEFTDLFIALSRAAGIPAREVDGYAYTINSRLRPLSETAEIGRAHV